MLTESEIKAYTVDIPNDIQAAQRASGSLKRMVRHVTCVNLKITVEADPRMPEGEIQGLINDALSKVVINCERWTTFGKMHITGEVPNDPSSPTAADGNGGAERKR